MPSYGSHDEKLVWKVIRSNWLCQLAFIDQNTPFCLPTLYGTIHDKIYIHGALQSRMLRAACEHEKICISIYKIHELVFARSGFNHTVNYESVTILGKGSLVKEKEKKISALHSITENLIPGRWDELREPTERELARTGVVEISFEEASFKGRTGDPVDTKSDMTLDTWAGTLAIKQQFSQPKPSQDLQPGISISQSVASLTQSTKI